MPITQVVPGKGGNAWGYNTDSNSWVPVDPQALQGSAVGNVGRGVGLGLQQVQQGAMELMSPNDPNVQAAGQVLQQQTQAAQNAAPWTTALGMAAPEIGAGIVAGAATGGMGLPAVIAGQMLAGGAVGALRPGDVGTRVQNSIMGAIMAGGGYVAGEVALKGIMAGLAVGRGVTEGSVEATAQGVINGVARQQTAQARAALAEGAGTELGQGGEAVGAGGSTVGAARTPGAAIDPLTAAEGQAMDQGEAIQRGTLDRGTQQQIQADSEALGYKSAYWAGTPKGSQARLLGSLNEFNPGQPAQEIERKLGNTQLVNMAGAKAMGAAESLDPVANLYKTLDLPNMAQARSYLNQGQEAVLNEMPGTTYGQFKQVLQSVDRPDDPGVVGDSYRKWVDNTMGDLTKAGDNKTMTGQGLIRQIRGIGEQIGSDRTDDASRQAFIELQNKLYNMAEQATKGNVAAGPHGGDQTITGSGWAQLRKQELMYRILRAPGAIDPQGNINARTVLRAMSRDPTSGGFGINGPLPGSPQRDLWTLLQGHLQNDLSNTVPPTGVRVLGALGKFGRGLVSNQLARTGLVGAGAATAANSIWGK